MLNKSRRDFLTFTVSLFALSQFDEMCHLQIDEMIPLVQKRIYHQYKLRKEVDQTYCLVGLHIIYQ